MPGGGFAVSEAGPVAADYRLGLRSIVMLNHTVLEGESHPGQSQFFARIAAVMVVKALY